MRKTLMLILTISMFAGALPGATWEFDKSHSTVGFKVKHMVIANVKGQFNSYDGSIEFDGKDFSTAAVQVTVDVASIDTQNEDRDKHLRSSDFFLADSFPKMTFKSKKVVPGTGNEFKIVGDLTLRGVTKEVTLDAEFNGTIDDPWGNTRAGFSATAKIDRQDFGLAFNKVLETGGLVVSDEVKIEIEVEAIKSK